MERDGSTGQGEGGELMCICFFFFRWMGDAR